MTQRELVDWVEDELNRFAKERDELVKDRYYLMTWLTHCKFVIQEAERQLLKTNDE